MYPIIVTQCIYFLECIMMRKVNHLLRHESDIIFIDKQVNFLLVVDNDKRLRDAFDNIVLDAIRVGLESHYAALQSEDFFLDQRVCLEVMEL